MKEKKHTIQEKQQNCRQHSDLLTDTNDME